MFCLPADSDVDTPMSRVAEPQTPNLERSGTRPVGFTALSVPAGEQVSTEGMQWTTQGTVVGRRDFITVIPFIVLALALVAVVLSPMLSSGFFGDDQMNSASFAKSSLTHSGDTLLNRIGHIQRETVLTVGRLFPLSTYILIPFYFANGDPAGFKVYVLVLVLLNCALFGVLVWRLSRSKALAILAVAALPLVMQVHSTRYHDPILGFAAHMQILAALLLTSLIAFLMYLDTHRRWALVVAFVTFCAALLLYEVTLAFPPLYLVVAFLHQRNKRLRFAFRKAWPFFAAVAVIATVTLGFRLHYGNEFTTSAAQFSDVVASGQDPTQGAYALNLSPTAVTKTLLQQMFATIPLTYNAMIPSLTGRTLVEELMRSIVAHRAASLFILFGYALFALGVYRSVAEGALRSKEHGDRRLAAGVAMSLLVLPNVLISLSPRYQAEVFWGVGYLPNYVSYFGAALLGALVLEWMICRVWPRSRVGAALVLVALLFAGVTIGAINLQNTEIEVEVSNRNLWYPRLALNRAVEHGLFDGVPEGSVIVVDELRPWDSPAFFLGLSEGRVERVLSSQQWLMELEDDQGVIREPIFFLAYDANWRDNGCVLVGRLSNFRTDSGRLALTSSRLFVQSAPFTAIDPPPPPGIVRPTPSEVGFHDALFERTAGYGDWARFDANTDVEIDVDPKWPRTQ